MPYLDMGSDGVLYIPREETMGKRVCVCGVTIITGQRPGGGYQPQACKCIAKPPGGEITHYVTYTADVPMRDTNGQIVIDVNGNYVFLHRKGDYMLDENGQPLIRPPRDTGFPKQIGKTTAQVGSVVPTCGRTHLDDLEYMGEEAFDVVFQAVAEEKMRRVAGGKPRDHRDDVVARL